MNNCEHLKMVLVDQGQDAVHRNETLAEHLQNCPDCGQLLQAWKQIPDLLDQLPEHEPGEELLRKVRAAASPGDRPPITNRRSFLAPSLASAAVLLAAIGLSRELLMHESPIFQATPARQRSAVELLKSPESAPPPVSIENGSIHADKQQIAGEPRAPVKDGLDESFDFRSDDASFFGVQQKGQEADSLKRSGSRSSNGYKNEPESQPRLRLQTKPESTFESKRDAGRDNRERLVESPEISRLAPETAAEELRLEQAYGKSDLEDTDGKFKLADSGLLNEPSPEPMDALAREPAGRESDETARNRGWEVAKTELPEKESPPASLTGAGAYAQAGFDFLRHYQQTVNLHFQPATGYWANTYIPGDPEIRLLSARLAQWDRSWLENNAALEREVTPVQQPFDAPADNALALSLMADVSAVSANETDATRMRLQVGIRGIEHRRGQRPAMNVAVVVDLPADTPDDLRIATRALLDALLQSKQAGDRFSLVMTGAGLVVPPPEFRFGSLQLAKQLILGQDSAAAADSLELSNIDLYQALERAGAMVQQTEDPSLPLGSSSVLLISANTLPNIERLAALAHARARDGVTLSVFPLGGQPGNSEVEQLVLAGLGNRRYLEAPGRARQLIEEELHASSRAVARAARLSIRLAAGVKLINVVGSERLDTHRAQRVRDIENSMDRRLSANLGIQADRGEDEDGIQIVIPSIFSGDSVTVLLDVVTSRPGAIADVSLRYKDLVFLRNGSLQGHLELPGGGHHGSAPTRGPAELAVLKNLLSHHFAEAVEQAAVALGRQQPDEATAILRAMRSTIGQARRSLPAWANDPDLDRDEQVLDRYIAALASPQAGAHQSFLSDSLRYAAWAKTHKELEEWK